MLNEMDIRRMKKNIEERYKQTGNDSLKFGITVINIILEE